MYPSSEIYLSTRLKDRSCEEPLLQHFFNGNNAISLRAQHYPEINVVKKEKPIGLHGKQTLQTRLLGSYINAYYNSEDTLQFSGNKLLQNRKSNIKVLILQ